MTFQECLHALRTRWLLVVLVALIGLGAAAAVVVTRPPSYTATLRMYVAATSGDNTGAAAQGGELAAQRVGFYTELVNSTRVTRDVVAQLKLPVTPEELAGQITATGEADSVFFDVSVTDSSADEAASIVNKVGDVLTTVVADVERSNSPNGVALVGVQPLEAAAVPPAPSSTGKLVTIALGLLSGLAVGIGLALARGGLDPSIRSLEQLRKAAGAPVLGAIAYDRNIPERPLPVHKDARGPIAEEFRRLRTNLQFVDLDTPPTTIVVTSPMPGAGKTTTVLNLGIALALAGERVLVIEADLRRPAMGELLRLGDTAGLSGVLQGRVQPEQAMQQWDGLFHVLACGPPPPNPSELLASRNMRALLDEVRDGFDIVLIDTPPLLPVADAAAIAPAADGAILVCQYKDTTRVQVASAVEALHVVSVPVLGAVLTMVPDKMSPAYSKDSSRYRGSSSVAAVAVAVPPRRARAARSRPPRPAQAQPEVQAQPVSQPVSLPPSQQVPLQVSQPVPLPAPAPMVQAEHTSVMPSVPPSQAAPVQATPPKPVPAQPRPLSSPVPAQPAPQPAPRPAPAGRPRQPVGQGEYEVPVPIEVTAAIPIQQPRRMPAPRAERDAPRPEPVARHWPPAPSEERAEPPRRRRAAEPAQDADDVPRRRRTAGPAEPRNEAPRRRAAEPAGAWDEVLPGRRRAAEPDEGWDDAVLPRRRAAEVPGVPPLRGSRHAQPDEPAPAPRHY